jgi:site-specific recombinase XerD
MVQAGIPLYEVQHVLGHKDISTTMRYAHLQPEHLRNAVAVLDRVQLRAVRPQRKERSTRT